MLNEWALRHETARWRAGRAVLRGEGRSGGRGLWGSAACWRGGGGGREERGGRSGKALAVSRIFHGSVRSLQGALRGGRSRPAAGPPPGPAFLWGPVGLVLPFLNVFALWLRIP